MILKITHHTTIAAIVLSLCLLPAIQTIHAQTGNWINFTAASFDGGTGHKTDPFRISTPEMLAKMAVDVNNSIHNQERMYYVLTADIDLGSHYWTPIGTGVNAFFKDILDGQFHTISNMYVNADNNGGLFGKVADNGQIRNLHIGGNSSVTISGKNSDNSTNAGTIAAYNTGLILNCSANASVNVTALYPGYVGGISGLSNGTLMNCYFRGSVNVNANNEVNIGGLVGNSSSGTINSCYNAGTLTATGSGKAITGSIIGKADVFNNCRIVNTYYLQDANSNSAIPGVGYGKVTATPLTAAELRNRNMPATLNGSPFVRFWKADANNSNDGFPILTQGDYAWTWQGEGTMNSPWIIDSAEKLNDLSGYIMLGNLAQDKYWKLTNDIDMASVQGFVPIGGWDTPYTVNLNKKFEGNLDGNGYSITNLRVQSPVIKGSLHGVFGNVGYPARISRLGIDRSCSIQINGNLKVTAATLVARFDGGTLEDCYSAASLSIVKTDPAASKELNLAGGLAGYFYENMTNCYFSGNISSTDPNDSIAAFIGRFDGGSTSNCYFLQDAGINANLGAVFSGTTSVTAQNTTQLTDPSLVRTLNGNRNPVIWTTDREPFINRGFPVLAANRLTNDVQLVQQAQTLIAPNPAKDYVRILLRGIDEKATQIRILRASDGKILVSQAIQPGNNHEINLSVSNLIPGWYLLQLISDTDVTVHKLLIR